MLFLIVAHAAQSQILVPTMIGAMQLLQLALGPVSTTKVAPEDLHGHYYIFSLCLRHWEWQTAARTLLVLRQRF